MDNQDSKPSRESLDGLALARQHVRALTDGGVSRQALLRALLEQEEASNELAPLPSLPSQPSPQAKPKPNPISRTLSLSQAKSKKSHWSISTTRMSPRHPRHPPSQPNPAEGSCGVLPCEQRLIFSQVAHKRMRIDLAVLISCQRRPRTRGRGTASCPPRRHYPLGQVRSRSSPVPSFPATGLLRQVLGPTGAHRKSYSAVLPPAYLCNNK